MSILYITDQGAVITKLDGRVVVRKGKEILEDLPARDVERVVIFGNAHITTPAMRFFLDQGIDVSLLSSHGRYQGRLQPGFCKDAELRRMQYRQSCNEKMCLAISKSIVSGKLKNMETLLKRQKGQTRQIVQALHTMKRALVDLCNATNLDAVRGYEGSCAAMYYKAFSSILPEGFCFETRSRQPPADKTNVLLSLGYTLLYNTFYAMVNIVGLDPYQGFFHQTHHGHAALASDLMEEFRSIIVDSVVLLVVNKGEITRRDFSEKDGRILLGEDGLKKYLSRYETRIRSEIIHPTQKIKLSYYQCIEAQVRRLARVVSGREKTYVPFLSLY